MGAGRGNRWPVVIVVGAVLLIGVRRAVDLFRADSARQVSGGLLGIAFFAWLTWRLFVQARDG